MNVKFTNLQRILYVFAKIVTLNTQGLQNIIFYDVKKQNSSCDVPVKQQMLPDETVYTYV